MTAPGAPDLAMRRPSSIKLTTLTSEHRYVPGKMFGGWGPHLGHLVRRPASGALYFVDDACAQAPAMSEVCDVLRNHRIDYIRLDAQGAVKLASQPLPAGVQQNTGSVQLGNTIYSYGVDVARSRLIECRYHFDTGPAGCAELALEIGAQANYVGAAVSPTGARVAWLTNVRDGGGGAFRYYVDYGGGWNGPRLGSAAGYNDASYINIAFFQGALLGRFTMHVQFVSGLAPSWSFFGGAGEGDLRSASPVSWQLLGSPMGDAVVSTNDIHIDPTTNDTHLLARTQSGGTAYLFRPSGSATFTVQGTLPRAYRARWIAVGSRLFLIHGEGDQGLAYRELPRALSGQPLRLTETTAIVVPLPAGYQSIYAIYPEAAVYQSEPVPSLSFAVVGAGRENEVLAVQIDLGG